MKAKLMWGYWANIVILLFCAIILSTIHPLSSHITD